MSTISELLGAMVARALRFGWKAQALRGNPRQTLKWNETMQNTLYYSDFLHCVYDEAEPRGHIGRGTHYSIFRAATWFDVTGKMHSSASTQDFAVIWDEDHDSRVISVVERMYLAGLMFPVLYVGERKGSLTVVLNEEFAQQVSDADRSDYEKRASDIAAVVPTDDGGDYWPVEFGVFEKRSKLFTGAEGGTYQGMLIQDGTAKTDIYLHNIHNLWSLGHKPYKFPKSVILETPKPLPAHRSIFETDTTSS